MTPIRIPRNAFHQTMVGLDHGDAPADLFSRACIEAHESTDLKKFGYPFTQIFEPAVLWEIALLEGVSAEALETLDHQPTATIGELRRRLDGRRDLTVVERINLASSLIGISRFDAAERARPEEGGDAIERFELAWIDFLISNRRNDGSATRGAFARMAAAIDEGSVPTARIIDVCTQGIVWYMKRREIDDVQYRWCLATGAGIIRRGTELGSGTISSWYRGLAMVPAARRDAEKTRLYMRHAYEHAALAATDPDSHGALNALKTYHESCIKEFMYVRPDLELAEQAGHALIALDAQWSPSYAELGEAYKRFGRWEAAAACFEKAVAMGPPYVGHHLLSSARARAALDDADRALCHFITLKELAPSTNPAICREAFDLATRTGHPARGYFEETMNCGLPVEASA